jgi:acetoin utilization protein AcuB
MTANVITVGPDDPVEQAAQLMLENKVGCLPVVEKAALIGIITESDIFRAFVGVLGVMEPGTRVQINSDDFATALACVAEVARSRRVRIISVISEPPGDERPGRLVVRFATLMVRPLVEALRAAGLDVDEPTSAAA